MFYLKNKSSDRLKEELEKTRENKDDSFLLARIPFLNVLELFDNANKEKKIKEIKKELRLRGEEVKDDVRDG